MFNCPLCFAVVTSVSPNYSVRATQLRDADLALLACGPRPRGEVVLTQPPQPEAAGHVVANSPPASPAVQRASSSTSSRRERSRSGSPGGESNSHLEPDYVQFMVFSQGDPINLGKMLNVLLRLRGS